MPRCFSVFKGNRKSVSFSRPAADSRSGTASFSTRRFFGAAFVLFFVLALTATVFVSCSSDTSETVAYSTADLSVSALTPWEEAQNKGLKVSVDHNIAEDTADGFYWFYTATKADPYGKMGETGSTPAALNAGSPGLGSGIISGLSVGKWDFVFYALRNTDGSAVSSYDANKVVYASDGASEVGGAKSTLRKEIKANTVNSIIIPVHRVQLLDGSGNPTKGTLFIDPTQITFADEMGSIVVYSTDSNSADRDDNAYKYSFSNKLSDYTYRICECDEAWNQKSGAWGDWIISTDADTAINGRGTTALSTKTSLSMDVGTHNIKVEIFRTTSMEGSGETVDTSSHAESFLAMISVEIFTNSVSVLSNDDAGVNAGIAVKRIKSFQINYKSFAVNTMPAAGNIIDWDSTNMIHSQIATNDPNIVENYPTVHQYGRTEELDNPSYADNGFDGYYTTNSSGAFELITSIPAFWYQDITVYAKWSPKSYASITYDANFPDGATVTSWTDADGTPITASGAFYDTSKSDTEAPMMPVANPEARGYVFLGWYVEALENTGTIFNSTNYDGDDVNFQGLKFLTQLPGAMKANIRAVCKGVWRPVRYHVAVQCKSAINPATDFTNYAEISAQVAELWAGRWSYYGESYDIIDPKSDTYGFIGYLRGTTSDHNPDAAVNTTYVAENMWVQNKYYNLSITDGELVYWYALFSDYFTPLEYIRSYHDNASLHPWINTLLAHGYTDSTYCAVDMTLDFAEVHEGSWNYFLGSTASAANAFSLAVTGDTNTTKINGWDIWGGNAEPVGGNWFYDTKYSISASSNSSGHLTLKVDGETVSDYDTAIKSGYTAALFARPAGANNAASWASGRNHVDMRLYSCNMYNSSGDILRRFQPCVLKATVPAGFSSDGVGTHTTGEVGLWDLVENKFYPNKGTGKFYMPSEEVEVRLNRNASLTDTMVRIQRVLSGVSEQLHRNLYTNANSEFLGWRKVRDQDDKYADMESLTVSTNTNLWAEWSDKVSYNLFSRVEWIANKDEAFIITEAIPGVNARATAIFAMHTANSNLPKNAGIPLDVFGTRGNATNGYSFMLHILNRTSTGEVPCWCPRLGDLVKDLSPANGYEAIVLDQPYYIDLNNINNKLLVYKGTNDKGELYCDETANLTRPMSGEYKLGIFCATDDSVNKYSTAYEKACYVTGDYAKSGAYLGRSGLIRCYGFSFFTDGVQKFQLVPAVLIADLTSATDCTDARGVYHAKANEKVINGQDCYAGEAGLWDLKEDKFYPNMNKGIATSEFTVPDDHYDIYFNGNGGLGSMDPQQCVISDVESAGGVRLNKNNFIYPGYIFTGWNTKSDGTGDWYSDERVLHISGNKALKNMTLFAQWAPEERTEYYTRIDSLDGGPGRFSPTGSQGSDGSTTGGGSYISLPNHIIAAAVPNTLRVRYKMRMLSGAATDRNHMFGGAWNPTTANVVGTNLGLLYGNKIYILNGNGLSYTLAMGTDYTVDAQWSAGYGDAELWTGSSTSSAAHNYGITGISTNGGNGKTLGFGGVGLFSNTPAYQNGDTEGRIYWLELWNANESLAYSFVPCILNQDVEASYTGDGKKHFKGELGMWDRLNGKFHGNSGNPGSYFGNDKYVIVTYEPNGGSGSMNPMAFTSGTNTNGETLAKNAFTYTGHTFIGWNTKADGTGIWFHDNYKAANWGTYGMGKLTLYAMWDRVSTYMNSAEVGSVSTAYFEPVNWIQVGGNDIYFSFDMEYAYPIYFGNRLKITHSGAFYNSSLIIMQGNNKSLRIYNTTNDCGLRVDWPNSNPGKNNVISGDFAKGKFYDTGFKAASSASASAWRNEETATLSPTGSTSGNAGTLLYSSDGGAPAGGLISYGAELFLGDKAAILVPCRILKSITKYEAASLTQDGKTHKAGEIGFWDISRNMFVSNSSTGVVTCELD